MFDVGLSQLVELHFLVMLSSGRSECRKCELDVVTLNAK